MISIGITGGIGSGKSTVCNIFEVLGVPVYYADDRAKYLMANNENLKQEIIQAFGNESFLDGKLNRTFLAREVFGDEEKVKIINQLVHPAVGKDFEAWKNRQQSSFILKEAALLFESGANKALDKVITVTCPQDIRIERVLKRDKTRTKDQVLEIINKQMPEEEKVKLSDFIINNDGRSLLIPQVLNIFNQLTTH